VISVGCKSEDNLRAIFDYMREIIQDVAMPKHQNEVIDEHEGSILCRTCGLVKDCYYVNNSKDIFTDSTVKNSNPSSLAKTILDKIHCPEYLTKLIEESLSDDKPNLKKVASVIYAKGHKEKIDIPLKTLMNVSGLKSRDIKSETDVHTLNIEKTLERYTKILNLNFKEFSLIKEKIKDYRITGYQPLTLIGGLIYIHCRKSEKRISMSKIAADIGISSISIRRFVKKHDVSSRC